MTFYYDCVFIGKLAVEHCHAHAVVLVVSMLLFFDVLKQHMSTCRVSDIYVYTRFLLQSSNRENYVTSKVHSRS